MLTIFAEGNSPGVALRRLAERKAAWKRRLDP